MSVSYTHLDVYKRQVQVQPVNDPPEIDLDGVGPGLDFVTTFFINRGPCLLYTSRCV